MNLWALLARAVEQHGARTAIAGEVPVTYARFGERAAALAAFLVARGLEPGARVAILADNEPEYLEVYFAAAGAGCVLCPLNTRWRERELREALTDAGARWLVAATPYASAARSLAEDAGLDGVLWLGGDAAEAGEVAWEEAHAARTLTPRLAGADEPAQLYFTSGTTGRSKGVVLTHRNVARHAENAAHELALAPCDVWGHFAPLFHLADAWATFALTLVGGAHVCVARFDAARVAHAMREHRVTLTNLVPTMLVRLVEHLREAPAELPDLRLVLSGGAPIAPSAVAGIEAALGCDYAQTYGMTETSPYLTLSTGRPGEALPLDREAVLRRRARTGRPFRGVELEVVDDEERPVPWDDRTVGEIRVRGETVSPGYWNRPDETALAFRGGWLYTGDLAVVDAAGWVDIVDRRKDMIVTGGENVYSVGVEHALCEHAAVAQAAAFGKRDPVWGERVVAAVVVRSGATASADELLEHCRARLAGYAVPRELVFLDELPATGSGKVDKVALRAAHGG